MKRWLPIGLFSAGLVLVVLAVFFWSNDEDRIRERLDRLAAAVRVSPADTNPAVRGLRIQSDFQELFEKNVSVSIPELSDIGAGRRELGHVATQAAGIFATADVSFSGTKIAIQPGSMGATVDTRATLVGARHGGETRRDERQVAFELEKIDGEWLIVKVTVIPEAAATD